MASQPTVSLHAHDKESLKVFIPCFVFGALSVPLRFAVKLKTKTRFGLDDWCLLGAFVLYIGYLATSIESVVLGVPGVPLTDVPIPILVKYLKNLYANAPISAACITFARYSILALYWRLFPLAGIHRAVLAVTFLCTAWFLTAIFSCFFRCIHPISAAWNVAGPPGKCFNFTVWFLAEEPINMLCDFLVVFLPVQVILKLKMPLIQKMQLSFVFAIGILTSLISAIRIGLVAHNAAELSSPAAGNWLFVQLTLAVIVVSLPTYGPLFSRSLLIAGLRDLYYSLSRRSRSSASREEHSSAANSGYLPAESQERIYIVDASGLPRPHARSGPEYPLNAISVKKTVEMV